MFGFGAGRLGPDDQTLDQLERSAKRGRLKNLPHGAACNPPPRFFERLRSLPRAEFVAPREVEVAAPLLPRPDLHVRDLALPAEEFVFQSAPLAEDFAATRIVHAQRGGSGDGTRLAIIVMSRLDGSDFWTITVPGYFATLDDFDTDPDAGVRLARVIGFEGLAHEMFCAATGLLAIDARQREMFGAVRH